MANSRCPSAYRAVLLVFICSILATGYCRRGCVYVGCKPGYQCDTSYFQDGSCVQVFTDTDLNAEEDDGDVDEYSHSVAEQQNREIASSRDGLHFQNRDNGVRAEDDAVVNKEDNERTEEVDGGDGGDLGAMDVVGATACRRRQQQEKQNCGGNFGCFITQCSREGAYSSIQCHGSTGYCWCVDANGQKLLDTEKAPGTGVPNCHPTHSPEIPSSTLSAKTDDKLSDCQRKRAQQEKLCQGLIGCFLSSCAADGHYTSKQCHGSTGSCWCVSVDSGERLDNVQISADGECPRQTALSTTSQKHATLTTPKATSETTVADSGALGSVSSVKSAVVEEVDDMNNLALERNENSEALPDINAAAVKQDTLATNPFPRATPSTTSPTEESVGLATIFLWIIVACCIAFSVSIPLILVCLCHHFRRRREPEKPYVIYTQDSKSIIDPGDQELVTRTARTHRPGTISNTSESSLILPGNGLVEPISGHMEISTGHTLLEYLRAHIDYPHKLAEEWQSVENYVAEGESTSDASSDYNAGKNRYSDILPYNDHRVKLDASVNASRSDYINASTICDSNPHQLAYIATQGPLDATVADFWQMVWEQKSFVIVMLTSLHDKAMTMCHRYWPDTGVQLYHKFEVRLSSEHNISEHYCVRSFYLVNRKTMQTRTVTQYQFLSWPSASIPKEAQPLLDFRRKVKKCYSDNSSPIIVHDNAGVGRAGCYILIDMTLNRLEKCVVKEIDMAASVEHLRDQRMKMVQTEDQFKFAYTALVVEVRAILDVMPK